MAEDPNAALAEAQHFIFVTQVFFCCMYAVVVWDWVTSLPREWRLIWKSRWTAAKYSYLFCRYWVILVMPYILWCFTTNHTAEECSKIYRSPVALATWNQAGAEVVLLIRTYAFFNRNRYLLSVLIAMLGGVLAYQLYVTIDQMLLLPFVTPPFTTGPCLPMSRPHSAHILGFFMASLTFDASVTTITLVKAFRIRRSYGTSANPLIQTFLREGVFYFVLISIANLVNGIFYLQPKAVMSAINIPLSIMFSDVLACRLILDLRSRGYEISQPTTHAPTLPTIQNGSPHGSNGTSLTYGDSSKDVSSPLPTPYHLPYGSTGSKKGGLKSLLDAGRVTPAFTTTINSSVFSTQKTDAGDGSGSMELRSFTPRLTDDDDKAEMDNAGLGLNTHSTDAFDGVRVDVERTQM